MPSEKNNYLQLVNANTLKLKAEWTLSSLKALNDTLAGIKWPTVESLTIDGSELQKLDSAGASWLINLIKKFNQQSQKINLIHFSKQHLKLIQLIEEKSLSKIPELNEPTFLTRVGKFTLQQIQELLGYFSLVGELSLNLIQACLHPKRFRWRATFQIVETAGFEALIIIALLSFMIGIVITYQMGLQLRTYGANIYIVDLLGLAILREFSALMTAIMVAGRTGSAFTAQLGTMKINQEIDALNTMGLSPTELLLLPRLLGLIITLPLLTMWANIFGILGGILMSHSMLNIGWHDFLHRFQRVVSLRSLLIGLGKAPIFAFVIASVGCFEGMRVKENADSVGKQTTKSVVISIFFIIIIDAFISIVLSKFKL